MKEQNTSLELDQILTPLKMLLQIHQESSLAMQELVKAINLQTGVLHEVLAALALEYADDDQPAPVRRHLDGTPM